MSFENNTFAFTVSFNEPAVLFGWVVITLCNLIFAGHVMYQLDQKRNKNSTVTEPTQNLYSLPSNLHSQQIRRITLPAYVRRTVLSLPQKSISIRQHKYADHVMSDKIFTRMKEIVNSKHLFDDQSWLLYKNPTWMRCIVPKIPVVVVITSCPTESNLGKKLLKYGTNTFGDSQSKVTAQIHQNKASFLQTNKTSSIGMVNG